MAEEETICFCDEKQAADKETKEAESLVRKFAEETHTVESMCISIMGKLHFLQDAVEIERTSIDALYETIAAMDSLNKEFADAVRKISKKLEEA